MQSTNDPKMALRMAEDCLAICRRYEVLPRQCVLYMGDEKMRMETTLAGFSYKLVDVRDLDGEGLLESPILNDIMDHEVLGREYKKGHAEGERDLCQRQDISYAPARTAALTLPARITPAPRPARPRQSMPQPVRAGSEVSPETIRVGAPA